MAKYKKIIYPIIIILVASLFIVPLCFAKSVVETGFLSRNWAVSIFYFIMAIASLTVLIGYCAGFRKKYFWLLLTIISVCICNVGYLALSLSTNVAEAILANKIAYFGNVFLPMFLLVAIADACRFRYNKFVVYILFSISVILYIFIATTGYLDIFYKSVNFEMVDGVVHLHKEYGIMHTFYAVYVFTYFAMMISVIIYSWAKKKLVAKSHIISLLLVVFINILIWFVEKFFDLPIEILSVSYVATLILTIYLYVALHKFGLLDYYNISVDLPSDKIAKQIITDEAEEGEDQIIEDNLANYSDSKLKELFEKLKIESKLSEREIEIAILMIKNIKRKKIAEFMYITEHTVKFHISNIYKKTNVNNRNELANLLKKQI